MQRSSKKKQGGTGTLIKKEEMFTVDSIPHLVLPTTKINNEMKPQTPIKEKPTLPNPIKVFSMYSGILGFEVGLENGLGKQNVEFIGRCEIDKYAEAIARYHQPNVKNYGDTTRIISTDIPDFNLLTGGFPCVSFSIAGKRKGFEDQRGNLFFEIARIIRDKRPKNFILENVRGILSAGITDEGGEIIKGTAGFVIKIIIATLTELDYYVEAQLLNSTGFGVPQSRERLYIVGHSRNSSCRKIFPFVKNDSLSNQENETKEGRTQAQHSTTLRSTGNMKGDATFVSVGTLRTHNDGKGFRETVSGHSPTIPARAREDGSGQPVIMEGDRIRRLTPVECERLQHFRDGYTQFGIDEKGKQITISDTQRYKVLGNAVTTSVPEYIAEQLYFPKSP